MTTTPEHGVDVVSTSSSAVHTFVRVFGAVVAATGAEHGVGEILQGHRPLPGLVIQSWPDSRFFRIENGEPALTVLRDPMAAGALTLVVCGLFLARTWFVDRGRHPRRDLIVLSVAMLLVGGGFGPPLLGLGVAIPAGWTPRPHPRAVGGRQRWLAARFQLLLTTAVMGWLTLVPILPIMDVLVGVHEAWIGPVFLAAVLTSILAPLAARARDAQAVSKPQERRRP